MSTTKIMTNEEAGSMLKRIAALLLVGTGAMAPAAWAEAPSAASLADAQKFLKATPDVVAHGKEVFAANCVTCHGAQGRGDGVAGAALNPHPRNFTSDQGWKFGRTTAIIFHTVSNGSPGTGMSAFTSLSVDDRIAVSHFVRSLTPNAPGDAAGDVNALAAQLDAAKPKPALSIERAIEKTAEDWSASHPGS